MDKRTAAFENKEFLENSININKFTVFFDKLPTNFRGEVRANAGSFAGENPLPQKHRENTTAQEACARRQIRGITGCEMRGKR